MNDLIYGLFVTLIGMSVVFLLLILLVYIISLIKYIFRVPEPSAPKHAATEVPQRVDAPHKSDSVENDEELVAVITSAIAAGLNTNTSNIIVRSIRRVDDRNPAWSEAGLHEEISKNR